MTLVGLEAAVADASKSFRALARRGCRPSKLKVSLCSMPEEMLLAILLNPLAASISCLHLRSADGTLPGAAAASRLAAAMTLLSGLHIELQAGVATEARTLGGASALLRAMGPNLRTLHLHLHLSLGPDLGADPAPLRQSRGAALLPDDLVACCPALTELRVQLRGVSYPGGDGVDALRQPALPLAAAAAALFASAVGTVAGLASLRSLELRFPGLALSPDAAAAAALPSLAALSRLTTLVLPIRASEPDVREDSRPPKSSHVVYGYAVRTLLLRLHRCLCRRTPPNLPASQQLVELDLGLDLALTLPYLPYCAPVLARLRVGELSAENVPASQWGVVPEPPPLLPLELLSGVPADLWEPMGVGSGGGGKVEVEGGDEAGGGGRPRCALPLCAVRLPPRLQVLQVRYMPDVAILAALAELPAFASLECTAVRYPQGEICLDMASIGVAGPPDLGARRGGGGVVTWSSGLPGMVAAAAGLLLRVLDEVDWRRHPLTLRPSPFSFLRDSYSRLRWSGPHAPWMAALAPVADRVTRVRLKQTTLQRCDVFALAGALPGLQSLELVRCGARRSDVRAWRAALGPSVVLMMGEGAGRTAPGEPGACDGDPYDDEDMFASSTSDDNDSGGDGGGGGGELGKRKA